MSKRSHAFFNPRPPKKTRVVLDDWSPLLSPLPLEIWWGPIGLTGVDRVSIGMTCRAERDGMAINLTRRAHIAAAAVTVGYGAWLAWWFRDVYAIYTTELVGHGRLFDECAGRAASVGRPDLWHLVAAYETPTAADWNSLKESVVGLPLRYPLSTIRAFLDMNAISDGDVASAFEFSKDSAAFLHVASALGPVRAAKCLLNRALEAKLMDVAETLWASRYGRHPGHDVPQKARMLSASIDFGVRTIYDTRNK
jgi:hypothetical protein